uniref:Uncharacterized protein LOC111137046 n=1 Tax=Crassostrea virginica TaxID=6565 RepID=A0A8B8EVG7_CRAVI|nr:uncharacterized protein LOC111137046 [Crassostrea virginica]
MTNRGKIYLVDSAFHLMCIDSKLDLLLIMECIGTLEMRKLKRNQWFPVHAWIQLQERLSRLTILPVVSQKMEQLPYSDCAESSCSKLHRSRSILDFISLSYQESIWTSMYISSWCERQKRGKLVKDLSRGIVAFVAFYWDELLVHVNSSWDSEIVEKSSPWITVFQ